MLKLSLCGTLLIAAPAVAQNTTCYQAGVYINCHTQPAQPAAVPPIDYLRAMGATPESQSSQQEATNANIAAFRQRHARAKLAKMIEDHDCAGAKDYALREDGLDAAAKVSQLCQ